MREANPERAYKPSVLHLRVLGCKTYVQISKERRITSYKVAPRAEVGILVGYDREHIYKVYMPTRARDKIVQSSNVRFDEGRLITDPLYNEEQLLRGVSQRNHSNKGNEAQNRDRESNDVQQLVLEVSLNEDLERIPRSAQVLPLLDVHSRDEEEEEQELDDAFEDALIDYDL